MSTLQKMRTKTNNLQTKKEKSFLAAKSEISYFWGGKN